MRRRMILFFFVLTLLVLFGTLSATAEAHRADAPTPTLVTGSSVARVRFRRTSAVVDVGQVREMDALLLVTPLSADQSVVWRSSDEAVVTVDEHGVATIVGAGSATVTAISRANPLRRAGIQVIARAAIPVRTIKLNVKNLTRNPGETYDLIPTISPKNATNREVKWSTSNASIATVDENGRVTANAPGICTIKATTDKGKKTRKITVRVRGGTMRSIKLSAVGDVVIGGDTRRVKKADDLYGDGLTSFQRFEQLYDAKGPDYFFEGVKDVFLNDDVTIVNFEGTLTNRTKHMKKTFTFKGYPHYNQLVADAGVDIANLANNHSGDFYSSGYDDTVRHLKAVGIQSFGEGGKDNTLIKEINGIKVGFCGFVMPMSQKGVGDTVRYLKKTKKCELVIASFHWTMSREWYTKTSGAEREAAHYAINMGADLVLGHHKHVVCGIEKYKGKMIIYDLGNFVAMIRNQLKKNGPYTDKDSMIYQQRFNVFDDGFVECVPPNIIPCTNSDTPDTMTGNPKLAEGEEAQRILAKIHKRTKAKHKKYVLYRPNY